MRSLRTRLLHRTTITLALTMVAAGFAVYLLMRASLLTELDAALLLEAKSLAAHVEQSGDDVQIEPEIGTLPEYSNAAAPHFYQIRAHESSAAVRSPSLGEFHLAMPAAPPSKPIQQSIVLPGGAAGRSAAIGFQPHVDDEVVHAEHEGGSPHVTLVVARDTAALDATLARLGGLLLVVTVAAVAVCVILAGGVIHRSLQPLDRLAGSIERVGVANLSERISLSDCPSELTTVVNCLNQLLGRLDAALTREKSFTADVAHELRTPLAGLETTLEVCATRPRDVDGYQKVVTNCLGITRGLHVLVDNLLQLARADANQCVVQPQPAEIASLIREYWLPFQSRASERGLHADWKIDGAARAAIDRESAGHVFTNLFDNAVAYAATGGQIRTSIVDQGGRVAVTIANSGCTLQPDDSTRVFDRFWRGDASRTGAGQHGGLGLSLCKKLVELNQGAITAEIHEGWFFVTVTFPSALSTQS